jgi:hypothetical protein
MAKVGSKGGRMKRAGALVVLVGALAAVGAVFVHDAPATATKPSLAAGQSAATVAALRQQVADLAGQVKALSGQVKTIKARLAKQDSYDQAIYDSETCITALTADALQGTWLLIDKVAQPSGTTYFGSLSPVDDKGACRGFKVTRSLLTMPPVIQGYGTMIDWLEG